MKNLKQLITGSGRLGEIIRFGMVGGIATVIQYVVYVAFANGVGLRAVPSQLISYAISFIFNYILSSRFTFHKKATPLNGIAFTLSHMINMGLQAGFVALFTPLVGKTYGLLPALAICIPINYLLVRFAFTSKYFQKQEKRELSEDA